MALGDTEEAVPAAEAIDDFGDLYPRRIGLHRYVVLSLSEDGFAAYSVDLGDLDCDCRDQAFDRDEGEICKHLAAALYQQPSLGDIEEAVVHDIEAHLGDMVDEIDHLTQRTTEVKAAAETAASDSTPASTEEEGDEWKGDPVEGFKSLLRDAGLDPDDFDIYVDDQYGSLQVDVDGYLDDDEFSTWVDFSNGIDMSYDGDGDINFLQPDRFPEVFG